VRIANSFQAKTSTHVDFFQKTRRGNRRKHAVSDGKITATHVENFDESNLGDFNARVLPM